MSNSITRRALLQNAWSVLGLSSLRNPLPLQRSFQILQLLHPRTLRIRPVGTARLHCSYTDHHRIIEASDSLLIGADSPPYQVTGPGGEPVDCLLEIPGVLQRHYFGTFLLQGNRNEVHAFLSMDCEIATGCIVGAELPQSGTLPNALAAQAVVSRSILLATTKPRHAEADFCDTTHCQFLRSPATEGSAVAWAIIATAGTLLVQDDHILSPRYSSACGGRTEAGLDHGQQYFTVACESCLRDGRSRQGHGWGLCQRGAIALARNGWQWPQILSKYYPAATLKTLPNPLA